MFPQKEIITATAYPGSQHRTGRDGEAMSKIMVADDFTFTPLDDGEAEFLLGIMDADHIVRLSYVATDGKDQGTYLSGPLKQCQAEIRAYRFRKRYAAVRLILEGREKEVKLGIMKEVFAESVAEVVRTRKDLLIVHVQMFGRGISVEVSAGSVNKIE